MIAVIPVRDGALPAGAEETAAEAGGNIVLIGSGCAAAATALGGGRWIRIAEAGDYAPGRWAAGLAAALAEDDIVLLPASPDGRDLAPRLAAELDRPLLAGAVEVARPGRYSSARSAGHRRGRAARPGRCDPAAGHQGRRAGARGRYWARWSR